MQIMNRPGNLEFAGQQVALAELLDEFDRALDDELRRRFVSAPVITVEDIDYPDTVMGDEGHLGFALLALLEHAGLSELDVTLEAWTLHPDGVVPNAQPFEPIDADARLAYGGTEHGRSLVVFDPNQLDTPENVIGAAALVVAEIYRDRRGLAGDRDAAGHTVADEFCGVALGFGVLLANASLHHQHHAEMPKHVEGGGRAITVTRRLGQLGPYRLGCLLAALAAASGDSRDAERIRDALDSDPRLAFDAAREALDAGDVARFGRPDASFDPSSPALDTVDMTRVDVSRSGTRHREATKGALKQRNSGEPVFRVRQRQVGRFATLGGAVGVVLLMAITAAGSVQAGIGAALTSLLVGLVYGWVDTYYECSDVDCLGQLDDKPDVCPECGGIVAGDIDDVGDRLAAAEEWEAQQGEVRQGRLGCEEFEEFEESRPARERERENWW
jgi:hypothetical protein